MPDCPSAQELVNRVKSLTRLTEGTFQTAWADSFLNPHHCCEQGGFIYVDYPVPATLTRAFVARAPKGTTMNQRTPGPNAAIDLNRPGIGQNNVILVANFHTHPLHRDVGGDPEPSRADHENAYARGIPGIVVSRNGAYGYGPERRENLNNLKGYPPTGVAPPAVPKASLVKAKPPPENVKNQWPETTGTSAERAAAEEEEEVVEEGESDVIVVEWSSEGVLYDNTVEDRED